MVHRREAKGTFAQINAEFATRATWSKNAVGYSKLFHAPGIESQPLQAAGCGLLGLLRATAKGNALL